MANKLKFDIDMLASFQTEVSNLTSSLKETSAQLTSDMEQLQKDWNTPAGKKFFEENKVDWQEHVDRYVEMLDVLYEMIGAAIREYEEVEAAAANITCE